MTIQTIALIILIVVSACLWGLGHWLERNQWKKNLNRYLDEVVVPKTEKVLFRSNKWEINLTLDRRQPFGPTDVVAKASAAFDEPFVLETGDLDPTDIAFLGSERAQVAYGEIGSYVGYAEKLFEIFQHPIEEGLLLTVRYTPSALHFKELEDGYAYTGKLAAQFIEAGPVTVTMNGQTFESLDANQAKKALCAKQPEAALALLKDTAG